MGFLKSLLGIAIAFLAFTPAHAAEPWRPQKPVELIAGGRDKGACFGAIEPHLGKKVKCVVLYDEARERIASSWKTFDRTHLEPDFRNAVRLAYRLAEKGDSVLLSPMCASFDQFSCFEERGQVFKEIFEELKSFANSKIVPPLGRSLPSDLVRVTPQ